MLQRSEEYTCARWHTAQLYCECCVKKFGMRLSNDNNRAELTCELAVDQPPSSSCFAALKASDTYFWVKWYVR